MRQGRKDSGPGKSDAVIHERQLPPELPFLSVLSHCPRVYLLVGGRSQGTKTPTHRGRRWAGFSFSFHSYQGVFRPLSVPCISDFIETNRRQLLL